jgi:hypothetical protein
MRGRTPPQLLKTLKQVGIKLFWPELADGNPVASVWSICTSDFVFSSLFFRKQPGWLSGLFCLLVIS